MGLYEYGCMPYARPIATVLGFTVSGSVDQSDGSFLDGTQTGTCADMHLISDLLLSFTHREMELHGSLCMCQWCFSISAAESEWLVL
ncbi:hypothetical protein C4D60_Mb10t14360 [Musa balbisiana]|uniref:Uncharacterized protein n=1 Tax=Musa balbisiana TaxID=52838 RepID=A0A4S8IYH1_MUSBA|nr:hypothetical protein C4D60_Mb10t14360 [Musa balbisiana]